jgi:NAD(P)-dependent dehydrogenase (short-subunit alcohol dehydrogenase family)
MRGKTVVITGGTSGIGEVAAVTLARMGARIVLIARDKTRTDATLARLREYTPGIAHTAYFADLLRLAEMKRVAAQVAEHEPRIDVLINNAGGLFATRRLTEDGLERTFALNHMAYFVVTEGLRERLLASSSTYHQHRLRRAPTRHAGFRRSSIGEELRSRESLSSVEAL